MPTQPGGGGAAAGSPAAAPQKSFWSCFSCRMLAGGGLAGAGMWVHMGVRQSLRQRKPGHPYDVFRLALAMGLYAGAIITIFDPVQPK